MYRSTLGSRVIKRKRRGAGTFEVAVGVAELPVAAAEAPERDGVDRAVQLRQRVQHHTLRLGLGSKVSLGCFFGAKLTDLYRGVSMAT